jgi:hypothetical protein
MLSYENTYGFDSFVISSFIVMLLFAVESAFRSFYSVTFAEDPPFKFCKHYNKLLPVFDLEKYIELLKFASLIRNTLHRGTYNLKDDSVIWRDNTYNFHEGKTMKLNDVWHTLIKIAEDVREMLEKLVKSDTIITKEEIVDAS